MKYRKKQVVVDAVQWTGGPDQVEDPVWLVRAFKVGDSEMMLEWLWHVCRLSERVS